MSVHRHLDHHSVLLKKRADYFFASRAYSRREVANFAELLLTLGPVVVIGGFLRDLCLSGNRHFRSDIDFVVDPASIFEFEHLTNRLSARVNKFGGYGITLSRWKVDVWPLERTWAAVAGHVSLSCLDDLLDVTFFDWDAILYSVADQKLISGRWYFDRVRRRVIDINLEPNPNPLGNAIRALRYAYRWEAALGERLASHVAKQIRDYGWTTLLASEQRSFSNPVLGAFDVDGILTALRDRHRTDDGVARLPLRPLQNEIPLIGGSTGTGTAEK
jgi:hypothetical protein